MTYVVFGVGLWPQNYRAERYIAHSQAEAETWIEGYLEDHPKLQESLVIEKRWSNSDFR